MEFKIGKVKFSEKNCVIIAEAGVNHNGSLKIAEKLIKEAKLNGADIIKFQTYKANKLVIKKSPRFWKWKGEIKKTGTQHDSYSRLDNFNKEEYVKLIKLCKKYDIEFMSTAFDVESVKMLKKIGMKGFKVASCDLNNFELLHEIAKTKLPILLSSGASNISEIKDAVKFLNKNGSFKVCIMHCTLCYPTKPKDSNLSALNDIRKHFTNNLLGLSDHTLGTNIAPASILYGVRVIEKHFTINKKLKKSADHWLSIDPKELKDLRNKCNEIFSSIGFYKKEVLNCERDTRKLARRSIVARYPIKKGEKLTQINITCKRPGTGISPNNYFKLIGKNTSQDIQIDEIINPKNIY
ncbi:N-acetylneuraminate synthase family protein [Candidatus Pelagibacter sp.]|nr:N-acetylneuraminate synthase family protein [Candidatus Pelagibacter sp.]